MTPYPIPKGSARVDDIWSPGDFQLRSPAGWRGPYRPVYCPPPPVANVWLKRVLLLAVFTICAVFMFTLSYGLWALVQAVRG
jgi:hypothetical protein